MTTTVVVDARARLAWPFLPASAAPETIWQGPTGELVRVLEDGTAQPVAGEARWQRSAAADPCAGLPAPEPLRGGAVPVSATPSAAGPHDDERPADAPHARAGRRSP